MRNSRTAALLLAFACAASAAPVAAASSVDERVAPWVSQATAGGKTAQFFVVLRNRADLRGALALPSKGERGRFVRDTLYRTATTSQRALLDDLAARGIPAKPFYIINAVLVTGDAKLALELAERDDVLRLEGNPTIVNRLPRPLAAPEPLAPSGPAAVAAIEPSITATRAPEVWASGFRGQGIVVGCADTGYRWDHAALKSKYRGWNGVTASHDYNWHDTVTSGGGSCGANAQAPCDDNGHGTHTAGTVLGDDGGSNQVGMAPGAKWIGCRNMNQGAGTPASYIECMEFFLAPYPVNGTPAQGDPSKAPDITTNSWGCPPDEGCSVASLQAAVEAQKAAGILMVVAAGNEGSGCSTVADPPAIYAASYTVGAIDHDTGNLAGFSSRGPVTVDGSNRPKPEITAPGVSIRSSSRTGGYTILSGTSMATPHVAGAAALLWSAKPALKNQVDQTIAILDEAAVDVAATGCSSSGVPNNLYGWGRLDIKAAVDAALAGSPAVGSVSPGCASTAGQGVVTILGANFQPGLTVTLAGTAADVQSVTGGNVVTVKAGARAAAPAATGDVVVTNPGPAAATLANAFTYALRGDASNDGLLSYADILRLNQLAFGSGAPALASPCNGDANGDGAVNGTDSGFLANALYGSGPQPGP